MNGEPDSSLLRASAAAFLRYEKQCCAISFEGGVSSGNPDALGVTSDMWLMECEIKVSVSDFKRDMAKPKWNHDEIPLLSKYTPQVRWFYFVVPFSLVEKVKPLLPSGCGLLHPCSGKAKLTPHGNGHIELVCAVKATANKKARKITLQEFYKMSKHQASTLCNLLGKFERVRHAARVTTVGLLP